MKPSRAESDLASALQGRLAADPGTDGLPVDADQGINVASGEQRVDVPVDITSDRLIQARASNGDIEIVRNDR